MSHHMYGMQMFNSLNSRENLSEVICMIQFGTNRIHRNDIKFNQFLESRCLKYEMSDVLMNLSRVRYSPCGPVIFA